MPEPVHVMAAMPEPHHVTAATPESPHIIDIQVSLGDFWGDGGYMPEAPADAELGTSLELPTMAVVVPNPVVSSPVASALPRPVVPEFLPLLSPILCVWAIHTSPAPPEAEAVQELSACSITATEVVHELTVSQVTVTEAIQEPTVSHAMATEAVHKHIVSQVTAMVAIHACSVTARKDIHVSVLPWPSDPQNLPWPPSLLALHGHLIHHGIIKCFTIQAHHCFMVGPTTKKNVSCHCGEATVGLFYIINYLYHRVCR